MQKYFHMICMNDCSSREVRSYGKTYYVQILHTKIILQKQIKAID